MVTGLITDQDKEKFEEFINSIVQYPSKIKFKDVGIYASGSKGFGEEVFLGSFNYFPLDEFTEGVGACFLKSCEVEVRVKPEYQGFWNSVDIKDGS
jgi:hypothetical protein